MVLYVHFTLFHCCAVLGPQFYVPQGELAHVVSTIRYVECGFFVFAPSEKRRKRVMAYCLTNTPSPEYPPPVATQQSPVDDEGNAEFHGTPDSVSETRAGGPSSGSSLGGIHSWDEQSRSAVSLGFLGPLPHPGTVSCRRGCIPFHKDQGGNGRTFQGGEWAGAWTQQRTCAYISAWQFGCWGAPLYCLSDAQRRWVPAHRGWGAGRGGPSNALRCNHSPRHQRLRGGA